MKLLITCLTALIFLVTIKYLSIILSIGSLTCTKLSVRSAGSFPSHAFECLQSDLGHHTQDNSMVTCVHGCVGELLSCTCWVTTLSTPYMSVLKK